MTAASNWRVGIDLGGTKIAGGLVDIATGAMTQFVRRPTPVAAGPQAIIHDVAAVAADIIAQAASEGKTVDSAGIAVPELVDINGRVCSDWNFAIETIGTDVSTILGGLPVMAESDVRAAAHAEARFGAGAGKASFVYVSLGTGMSYTFCMGGRPWSGANGFAIHFASSTLALPMADDSGLTTANAEDFASGKGMQATYTRLMAREPEQGVFTLEAESATGDLVARRILDEAGEVAGRLMAQMVNMLDPQAVVLGGGLGLSTGRYRAKVEQFMRENIWAERCRSIPVLPAALGEGAGVIGAALAEPVITSRIVA